MRMFGVPKTLHSSMARLNCSRCGSNGSSILILPMGEPIPSGTVVFVHSGFSSVEETTYLGMVLNLSGELAVPLRPGVGEALVGHAPEQQRLGAHRLVELELVALVAPADLEASSLRT